MIKTALNIVSGAVQRLGDAVGLFESTRQEIGKTAKTGVNTVLKGLELVNRDEFESQTELLTQICDRLQIIQQRLDALDGGESMPPLGVNDDSETTDDEVAEEDEESDTSEKTDG